MIHNVIIIGSGPAGSTAGIYSARAKLNPVIVSGYIPGGQLMTTTDVENFPGYTSGISGPDMMLQLHQQASRFGTVFIDSNVASVDCRNHPFIVTLNNGDALLSKSIIVATGAEAMWLGLEGEKKLRSQGLSSCAVCDGAFYEGQDVIVVGGGDSAMEEALFLTRYAKKVTIVHRRNDFRASKIMLERAQKNPCIDWITNATVQSWLSNSQGLCGAELLISDGDEKISQIINCTGAFMAIGHEPVSKFLEGQVELDDNGYILHKKHTMTSVPGIFACGDVVDNRYRQAATAAGMGCQAAMDCEKWLEELEN